MSFGTPRTSAPRLCSAHHLLLLGKHPGAGTPARGVRPCGTRPAPISFLGGGCFLGRLGGKTGRGRRQELAGAWGRGQERGRSWGVAEPARGRAGAWGRGQE